MADSLTEKEFSQHLNTNFRIKLERNHVDLELVEVKGYPGHPGDQDGMERFSLFFKGPAQTFLSQGLYSLNHDGMGAVDIFLVPIQPDGDGSRYEAVFNYFKNA